MSKIITFHELAEMTNKLRNENKTIVTTNGVFDIIHLGHINYLKAAKQLGDVLMVGLNTDHSVKQIKGPKRPLNNEEARLACIAALECVDYAFLFDHTTPTEFLSIVKPDIHVKGGDYAGKEHLMKEKETVESNGGSIKLIDFSEGYSTTSFIQKIVDVYGKKE